MGKRKGSKRGSRETRREIETRAGEPCLKARPMHEEIAEDAVAALVARAGMEPEDEDGRTDSLLAREALKRLAFAIVGGAMDWAREGGEDGRSAWAGRFLAELATVLEKREAWIAKASPAFKVRRAALRPFFDLQAKPAGPSPYMRHLLSAYGRMIEVCQWDADRQAWREEGAEQGGAARELLTRFFPEAFLRSEHERKIPALVEEIERSGGEGAEKAWFERVLWPMLEERRAEIMADSALAWELARERERMGLRRDSFASLKTGFRKTWRTLYARPAGRLVGIERERG